MSADPDGDELVNLLTDVARQMRARGDQLTVRGMSSAQLTILTFIERQPGLSQNELAAHAELAPITVARLIDRLEALGLVKRCIDPDDRRIWRLWPTSAAMPLIREIEHFRTRLRSLMTQRIEPAVLQATALGLRQMQENLSDRRLTQANR
jgi:MarR family transcriptional regulator, transcriptional regulator for hemolysin